MTDRSTMIHPPWNPEQVEALNAWQGERFVHPFTCPGRSDDDHRRRCKQAGQRDHGILLATENGWVCPVCGYTQGWAHDFMADPDMLKIMARVRP